MTKPTIRYCEFFETTLKFSNLLVQLSELQNVAKTFDLRFSSEAVTVYVSKLANDIKIESVFVIV